MQASLQKKIFFSADIISDIISVALQYKTERNEKLTKVCFIKQFIQKFL